MTTREIELARPALPALAEEQDPETFIVPGMENVQPGELRIPILRLVQGTSRMEGAADHIGQWHNSVTGEFIANPEILIIGVARGRVMFPKDFSADNEPLCASDDGTDPRREFKGQTIKRIVEGRDGPEVMSVKIGEGDALACAGCPFGAWGEDGTPPACQEVATFAGVGEDGLPAILQLRGTSMKNVAALKTLVAANGIRKSVVLRSIRETNDSGTYVVATFGVGGKPSKDWQKTALRLAAVGNLAARNQAAAMRQADQAAASGASAQSGGDDPFDGVPDDMPF